MAFGGLSLLIGAIALVAPLPTQGSGDAVGPAKPALVVNTPAEPLPLTHTVNVSDLPRQPAPGARRGRSSGQPFQGLLNSVKWLLTVPEGKRLVIQ